MTYVLSQVNSREGASRSAWLGVGAPSYSWVLLLPSGHLGHFEVELRTGHGRAVPAWAWARLRPGGRTGPHPVTWFPLGEAGQKAG